MSNSNLKINRCALIISGPSGSGKTSLAGALIASDPNITLSVSVTTRMPRPDEIEGQDYYFTDHASFSSMVVTAQMLEFTELYGNFYGTLKRNTEELLNNGLDVLFDIDAEGAKNIKSKLPDRAISIFIMPPSITELGHRLQLRSQDSQMNIAHRINCAKEEIRKSTEYDYIVENSNFEVALSDIKAIVTAERLKCKRIISFPEYIEQTIIS